MNEPDPVNRPIVKLSRSGRVLRFAALAAVACVVIGGVAFLVFPDEGPLHCWIEKCYDGKPAKYWVNALQDKDPKVVNKAMDALFEIKPPSKEAARTLLAMIKADPDPNSLPDTAIGKRPELASITLQRILRSLGPDAREFIPDVIELLHSHGVFHRMRACKLLGEMGSNAREAVPELRRSLSDAFPPVAKLAAEALRCIESGREPHWMY
ncbi:MAG TPA: HEAT repeat domain-containing protein [Gemmataceae bacterium]|nr:HEAT repeat domain-containing protein [Gemmataceae bacterium]